MGRVPSGTRRWGVAFMTIVTASGRANVGVQEAFRLGSALIISFTRTVTNDVTRTGFLYNRMWLAVACTRCGNSLGGMA